MICPKCNRENPKGAKFCSECSHSLSVVPKSGKKRDRLLFGVIGAVAALLFVGIGVGAALLFLRADKGSVSQPPSAGEGTSVVEDEQAAKEYLLEFRDITNRTAPSVEERAAVMASEATGKLDKQVASSLQQKAQQAVEEIKALAPPPTECQKVHELGIQFYQMNADMYANLIKAQEGDMSAAQAAQQLTQDMIPIGQQLDEERRTLHQKYNLGEL